MTLKLQSLFPGTPIFHTHTTTNMYFNISVWRHYGKLCMWQYTANFQCICLLAEVPVLQVDEGASTM